MKAKTLLALIVAFLASFCIMMIELVATRILAPYLGMHLYSWTSIIGVCLAGISIGAWIGGMIADAWPTRATLGWLLFIAGLLTAAIPFVTDTVGNGEAIGLKEGAISLMNRILIVTCIVFLPAQFVLGMISPVVVRLSIDSTESAGSTVGRIYAFSTVGSIIGTFLTGFYLIEMFGTRTILYGIAGTLIFMAPLFGGMFSSMLRKGVETGYVIVWLFLIKSLLLLLVVAGCFYYFLFAYRETIAYPVGKVTLNLNPHFGVHFSDLWDKDSYKLFKESNYFTLRVHDRVYPSHDDEFETVMLRDLVLDHLVHSNSMLGNPKYLKYEYLHIYRELVDWKLQKKGKTEHRELFIGGGGYTLPRYFRDKYADSYIDVAEIDPWVTKVAEDYLEAPKNDPRLVTENVDGRLFVKNHQNLPNNKKYDFVFGDAFNDLSVPFHLTTKEFNDQVKDLMTDDGLFMALIIDHVSEGLFLPSFLATMRATFGDDNVHLMLFRGKPEDMHKLEHQTVIVVASKGPFDLAGFQNYLAEREDKGHHAFAIPVDKPTLDKYLTTRTIGPGYWERLLGKDERIPWTPIVLTDNFAPVDNLTAPMFEMRYGYEKEVVDNKTAMKGGENKKAEEKKTEEKMKEEEAKEKPPMEKPEAKEKEKAAEEKQPVEEKKVNKEPEKKKEKE